MEIERERERKKNVFEKIPMSIFWKIKENTRIKK